MIPQVQLGNLKVSRLILGGNPFSGFSHQNGDRDREMMDYYTAERIKETFRRAEAAGINTVIMRSDLHIHRLLREYYNEGGKLQWIAQVGADSGSGTIPAAIEKAVQAGAKAIYIHGGQVDAMYNGEQPDQVDEWMECIRSFGIPAGAAGHIPEAHLWAAERSTDFHAVAFYNCGSLHRGGGERFEPEDVPRAVDAIRRIDKPCIGYKILGAGRVGAEEGFHYAFENIKPGDMVNVGMYRGDCDDMVEINAAITKKILT